MELSEIREKIDAVDEQLLDLFLQRMDLSDEVAAYKNAHHLPILNKERERAILAKVTGEVCRAAGEGGAAAFVEVAGTILALAVALPLAEGVLTMMAELLG